MIGLIFQKELILIKKNASKECWCFIDKVFKYEPYLCNCCHDLMQNTINFNDIAIVSVKGSNCGIYIWYIHRDDQ